VIWWDRESGDAIGVFPFASLGERVRRRVGTAQHLNAAVAEIEGPGYRPPGLNAESTSLSYLKALFEAAGLTDVDTHPIEIPVTFQDFDDYWNLNTTFASPIGGYVKGLSGEKRQRLMQLVKSRLPIDAQDVISYAAQVNAVRGRA
jgi:hypothetical protein